MYCLHILPDRAIGRYKDPIQLDIRINVIHALKYIGMRLLPLYLNCQTLSESACSKTFEKA